MTHHDRLMKALFDNPEREHIDIKFFTTATVDVSDENFCEQAANMLEQMDAGVDADEHFHEEFEKVSVASLIAA